jgi:adenine-specific DNA-methyltransferase
MPKATSSKNESSAYKHLQETVQRPDVGVEAQFPNKKAPKTYRYDSSLAPELCWDESGERPFAEWLLNLVSEAAEKGETVVFAKPQTWEGTQEQFTTLSQCAVRLKSLTKPFLNWTGKAERQQISVPTLPLFVHERHSTHAILETLKSHRGVETQTDLFGDPQLDIADKLDAYQHKGPWTNRLVLGDSLQVMNSLLEYEGMGGQVQMIYFDPPYGVKFGSNFQPFVRKNNVKHGPDEEMIREPEMVRAYRDTWELGLHSYLTYMRDRALLAKELLSDSGSIFIQISDENLHHVREVMDEVFGAENFLVTVFVRKKGSQRGNEIKPINDYLLWFCKNKSHSKIRFLYHSKLEAEDLAEEFEYYETAHGDCGSTGSLSSEDLLQLVNNGGKLYVAEPLTSGGEYRTQMYPVHYKGQVFRPPANNCWKFNEEGMSRIAASGRLHIGRNQIRFKKYHTDFPFRALNNLWAPRKIIKTLDSGVISFMLG